MISHRLARWSLLGSLAGSWLTLIQSPVYSQDYYAEVEDLDELRAYPGRLERDLDNELDDIFEYLHPDQAVSINVLFNTIMLVLSDEGDGPEEEEIDLDDLEREMGESGVSVRDVVWQAIQEADVQASRQLPFGAAFIRVAQDGYTLPRFVFPTTRQRILERIYYR